jgi:hypothetical protein
MLYRRVTSEETTRSRTDVASTSVFYPSVWTDRKVQHRLRSQSMKHYLISCEPDMATACEYLQQKPQ